MGNYYLKEVLEITIRKGGLIVSWAGIGGQWSTNKLQMTAILKRRLDYIVRVLHENGK